jgi:hypothetical protein
MTQRSVVDNCRRFERASCLHFEGTCDSSSRKINLHQPDWYHIPGDSSLHGNKPSYSVNLRECFLEVTNYRVCKDRSASCRQKKCKKEKQVKHLCNRRPIGLWDVEAPTFSRQSAHRWRWGCRAYAPASLYPQEDSWYSFLLQPESTPES